MGNSGIYGLIDPRDGCLAYVGYSVNFKKRVATHCSPSHLRKPTKKNNWIKYLISQGLKPILEVIEEIELSGDKSADLKLLGEAEIFWIASFVAIGVELKNGNDGGKGECAGRPLSEEHKAKLLMANLGRSVSKETRSKLSAANLEGPDT